MGPANRILTASPEVLRQQGPLVVGEGSACARKSTSATEKGIWQQSFSQTSGGALTPALSGPAGCFRVLNDGKNMQAKAPNLSCGVNKAAIWSSAATEQRSYVKLVTNCTDARSIR